MVFLSYKILVMDLTIELILCNVFITDFYYAFEINDYLTCVHTRLSTCTHHCAINCSQIIENFLTIPIFPYSHVYFSKYSRRGSSKSLTSPSYNKHVISTMNRGPVLRVSLKIPLYNFIINGLTYVYLLQWQHHLCTVLL